MCANDSDASTQRSFLAATAVARDYCRPYGYSACYSALALPPHPRRPEVAMLINMTKLFYGPGSQLRSNYLLDVSSP